MGPRSALLSCHNITRHLFSQMKLVPVAMPFRQKALLPCVENDDLHEAVLKKEDMTVFQVSGVLRTHDSYLRLMTAINYAGIELYFKAFHGTNEIPGSLGLPTEPDKLYKHLQKYQAEFEEMKTNNEITEEDFNTLFPPGRKETFSQEFAFPLFQSLLRMFDRAGSDDDETDDKASEEDERERFLEEMEKLYEMQTDKKLVKKLQSSHEKFQDKWNELCEVLKSLNYDVTKLEPLQTCDLEENNKFRFALLRSELSTLAYECDDCAKTVKMNHLALDRLKDNFQVALSESKTNNNNVKCNSEIKDLKNLIEEIGHSKNKIDVQKHGLNELAPNIKFWREKNIEGDIIVFDESISKLRDDINEQTRRVSDLFNTVSFNIVHLKERAYSITGEIKVMGPLPTEKAH